MANVPPAPQGGPLPGPPPPAPPAAAFQMSPAENDAILTFPQDNKIYFKATKGLILNLVVKLIKYTLFSLWLNVELILLDGKRAS